MAFEKSAIGLCLLILCCIFEIHGYNTQRTEDDNIADLDDFTGNFLESLKVPRAAEDEYVIFDDDESDNSDSPPLNSWSVVWYIACFGGLIAFFLVVSCSEWCCRRAVRNAQTRRLETTTTRPSPDTPPPSYEHFAPPSYESICLGRKDHEKSEYDVYVVPVHSFAVLVNNEDAPPSYLSASNSHNPT